MLYDGARFRRLGELVNALGEDFSRVLRDYIGHYVRRSVDLSVCHQLL